MTRSHAYTSTGNVYMGFNTSLSRSYRSMNLASFLAQASNPPTPNLRNKISTSLAEYIDGFDHTESFSDAFQRLGIDPQENHCMCPISHDVVNKPVRISGVLFDYSSLLALPVAADGTRENPMTREGFYLDQLQPDRECKERIESIITQSDTIHKLKTRRLC